MKGFVIRGAVKNCSESVCELVSSPSFGGLAGWGEGPDLAYVTGVLFYPAVSSDRVIGLE